MGWVKSDMSGTGFPYIDLHGILSGASEGRIDPDTGILIDDPDEVKKGWANTGKVYIGNSRKIYVFSNFTCTHLGISYGAWYNIHNNYIGAAGYNVVMHPPEGARYICLSHKLSQDELDGLASWYLRIISEAE